MDAQILALKKLDSFLTHLSAKDRLIGRTAHETHHLWEARCLPERTKNKQQPGTISEWMRNRAEYAAELYALMIVKNRKTEGLIDWMRKMVGTTKHLWQIREMERDREQYRSTRKPIELPKAANTPSSLTTLRAQAQT